MRLRKDIFLRKDEIVQYIKENKPKYFICEKLKCKQSTLNDWLKKLDIDYDGQQNWAKGITKKPIEFYLKKNSKIKSDELKKKLFEEGIKEKKCEEEICQITNWAEKKISFHLHHKDGDKYNNELINLKILCPNCHYQTDNYCKKINKKINKKIIVNVIKNEKYFCQCGKVINKNSKNCPLCDKIKQRKIPNRPSLQTLLDDLNGKSYLEVGRKYNVSDNCIRKWIKRYNTTPPKKLNI